MPRYDPQWLGTGLGLVRGGKFAAVREGGGLANKRIHTHTHDCDLRPAGPRLACCC